mmetsp:Transcript_23534/g.37805  ORF Transcript_23534/g.37805 Transcript_23534/m.37805 type:complete len:217 (-) Transcript_23534:1132-1782(-)
MPFLTVGSDTGKYIITPTQQKTSSMFADAAGDIRDFDARVQRCSMGHGAGSFRLSISSRRSTTNATSWLFASTVRSSFWTGFNGCSRVPVGKHTSYTNCSPPQSNWSISEESPTTRPPEFFQNFASARLTLMMWFVSRALNLSSQSRHSAKFREPTRSTSSPSFSLVFSSMRLMLCIRRSLRGATRRSSSSSLISSPLSPFGFDVGLFVTTTTVSV